MKRINKPRSGIALGGLGCGWFEIRQDGCFYNWNIFNNRPLGRGHHFTLEEHSVLFFVVRHQVHGEEPRLRLLQIEPSHGSAAIEGHEFHYIFPWIDGVDRISYDATVPFANLTYVDSKMPLEIELTAWSPFIPRDIKNSSLPLSYFDFSIRSTATKPIDVTILASMRNCVGYDIKKKYWIAKPIEQKDYIGFEMSADKMDRSHPSYGNMGVISFHPDSTYHIGWEHLHPYYENLLNRKDFSNVNEASLRNGKDDTDEAPWAKHRCLSSVGYNQTLEEGEGFTHRFAASWYFPNNYARLENDPDFNPGYLENVELPEDAVVGKNHIEGHYYSNFFESTADVLAYAFENATYLLEETRRFHVAQYRSTLPEYIIDQVNSQLNTFRTSSWFTKDGNFGILEGLSSTKSYAGLATMDVSMYGGVSTAAIFPELEYAVYRAHKQFQAPSGFVSHSIAQNFRNNDPRETTGKRVDMPAQYVYQALRIGLWTGDKDYLNEIWPSAKRALDYILKERDNNADYLPDMHGVMCSYDNFPMYGVAPYTATQWLAAIATAIEVARIINDDQSETRYTQVLLKGSETLEKTCWNGSYYRLYSDAEMNEGCMTDQIIGHWALHLLGIPPFLDQDHIQKSLKSIIRLNYNKEQGLRNCQWPEDEFLHPVTEDCWVDQANTCWTGVELAFASLLIYEGLVEDGFKVIKNVDDRYRHWGMYWDHQEFGGHYFRPMSAWAIVNACLGLSINNGTVTFSPKVKRNNCRLLWVTPSGYGHYKENGDEIRLIVISGNLCAEVLRFALPEDFNANANITCSIQNTKITVDDRFLVCELPNGTSIQAESEFIVRTIIKNG